MNTKEKIKAIPYWYHRIDLGDGVVTPGFHPHQPSAYDIPADLTGKRVLDIGAWDGYWTFDALKRGAREVIAIDNWSDMPLVDSNKRDEWDSFDLCKKALGYTDQQCRRYTMSLYDAHTLGKFDIVFFFGALYHQRYPLLALDKLSEICTDEIYIETAICNDYSPYKGEIIGAGYANALDVVMEFYPDDQLGGISSNWWSPTLVCLHYMIKSAGWKDVDTWKFENPLQIPYCRGFAKGKK